MEEKNSFNLDDVPNFLRKPFKEPPLKKIETMSVEKSNALIAFPVFPGETKIVKKGITSEGKDRYVYMPDIQHGVALIIKTPSRIAVGHFTETLHKYLPNFLTSVLDEDFEDVTVYGTAHSMITLNLFKILKEKKGLDESKINVRMLPIFLQGEINDGVVSKDVKVFALIGVPVNINDNTLYENLLKNPFCMPESFFFPSRVAVDCKDGTLVDTRHPATVPFPYGVHSHISCTVTPKVFLNISTLLILSQKKQEGTLTADEFNKRFNQLDIEM